MPLPPAHLLGAPRRAVVFACGLSIVATVAGAQPASAPDEAASAPVAAAMSAPAMTGPDPLERLLTCKAAFRETVQRHVDASKELPNPASRVAARQAAVDQALALAVLEDAEPDVGEPLARHVAAARDKRHRPEVLAYCRHVVLRYADAQGQTHAQYLAELRPVAAALVDTLGN